MVALRLASTTALVLLTALLAGCSGGGGNVIQLVDGQNFAASGTRTASGSCDTDALVQVTASGQSGSFRVRVLDGDGDQVYDSGTVSGSAVDQSLDVEGASGKWTVHVDRMAYSGSYTVQVVC